MTFDTLGLAAPLLRALADAGHATPTDVQRAALPPAIAGRDLMIASSTGSGKTAAYLLPALERVLAARAAAPRKPPPASPAGPARATAEARARSFSHRRANSRCRSRRRRGSMAARSATCASPPSSAACPTQRS